MLHSLLIMLVTIGGSALADPASTDSLRLQSDEAVAALRIMEAVGHHIEPPADAWSALYASDGYRRLKRREAAMGRAFTDSSFALFLRADSTVARRESLRRTLMTWQRMDLRAARTQALSWLPTGARISATIYLLIKPRPNSFVFDTDTDPAIMLYLDPAQSTATFSNHVVHELHHIGYASVCDQRSAVGGTAVDRVRIWLGAFGEGFAMLAAAGGLSVHPHATSPRAERARWDHDVAGFDGNLGLI
jgi:hypothetical protein